MPESVNCLMLRTADSREFFTEPKHFTSLVDFAKTCSAEISVVRATDVKIQDLEELARSICDGGVRTSPNYEVVEIKLSQMGEINSVRID